MTSEMQLQWRRSKVLELESQGYSNVEIAAKLHVDDGTIGRDLSYLRKQARESLLTHINEVIPMQYQRCMVGMQSNLKEVLEIAQTTADPRVKLQARAIVNDCYKIIMDLVTNHGVITDAMKMVNQMQQKIVNINIK
jgi:hypothetical protein